MKHWEIRKLNDPDFGFEIITKEQKWKAICDVHKIEHTPEETKAHAELISRAPELLEENESLKAVNKQLLEALEPFGKLANECLNNSSMNQNQTVYAYNRATITMLDLKKVSEILSKSKL